MNDKIDVFMQGFLAGVTIAITLTMFSVGAYMSASTITHKLGWKQYACVDVSAGQEKLTTYCVTGEDIAKWAQEHKR